MAETLINGYHLIQFCGREYGETISFSTLENDLGDGYDECVLFGSNTGLRRFSIGFQSVPAFASSKTYELDGVLYTPAEYLWQLFVLQKTERKVLVIQSQINNQYYPVKFIDREFTLQKALTALYSGQAVFQQIRREGLTVFDVSKIGGVSHWFTTPITGLIDGDPLTGWDNELTGGENLAVSGGVNYQTDEQNGLPIVRLDTALGADTLDTEDAVSTGFYEMFLVMKYRAATFTDFNGIVSNNDATAGTPALIGGGSGTTKFYDLGLGAGYEYRKNGVAYAANNQQAPMDTFGIVHIRLSGGWTMPNGIVFGADRVGTYPTRVSNVDFGEIIICDELLPRSTINEITEYLGVKWGINV